MSLKTQNIPVIIVYVIFNFSIFFIIYKNGYFDIDSLQNIFQEFSKKDGVFFILLPIILIIFQGILPAKIKEILVFWKIKNRLPGCQAFSKYLKEDNRIDKRKLMEKYGKLPKKEEKQNKFWYKIYKEVSSDTSIAKTHKDYLLTRELTILTIFFIFIFPIILFYNDINIKTLILFMIFLILEYLIIRYASKNYAVRLVTNVMALASAKS